MAPGTAFLRMRRKKGAFSCRRSAGSAASGHPIVSEAASHTHTNPPGSPGVQTAAGQGIAFIGDTRRRSRLRSVPASAVAAGGQALRSPAASPLGFGGGKGGKAAGEGAAGRDTYLKKGKLRALPH